MTTTEDKKNGEFVMETFVDVDGSTRCKACALHPDECTCRPDHPIRRIVNTAFEREAAMQKFLRVCGRNVFVGSD